MKDSEILKKARGLIASEVRSYICNAIDFVVVEDDGMRSLKALRQAERLKTWIKKMLEDDATADGLKRWLERRGVPPLSSPPCVATSRANSVTKWKCRRSY